MFDNIEGGVKSGETVIFGGGRGGGKSFLLEQKTVKPKEPIETVEEDDSKNWVKFQGYK